MKKRLIDKIKIVNGTRENFRTLKDYHYIPEDPVYVRGIYVATPSPEYKNAFPDVLGVIVYAVPIGEWRARNRAVEDYFSRYKNKSARQSSINRNVSYIARVIVDPRFHKLGIGSKLVADTLTLQTHHWIETMTPPDRYMKMFTKLGFRSVIQPTPDLYLNMQRTLDAVGLSRQYWTNPEVAAVYLDNLNKYRSDIYNRAAKKFLQNFRHHENELRGYERIRYILTKIKYPNMYFLYTNPRNPIIE